MENIGLWSALLVTFVITNSFSLFMLSLNRMKNRAKVSWQLTHKLETSFLLMDFSKEEIEKEKTDREWTLLIDQFRIQYAFFEKYLLDEGYKNKSVAAKWKNYITKDLRKYLIKWEEIDIKEAKVKNLEQPEGFFGDFQKIKKISKRFYLKINPKAKTITVINNNLKKKK